MRALIFTCVLGLLLPGLSAVLQSLDVGSSSGSLIKRLFVYELVLASLGLTAAWMTCRFVGGSSPGPLALGSLDVIVTPVRWLGLGVRESATWRQEVVPLTLVISLVTGLFVYLSVRGSFSWSLALACAPAILLFSALNAAGEEWLYRIALLRAAESVISPEHACLLSAAIFGVAHVAGMPGGPMGCIAAGILGYALSHLVLDTGGLASAWFVHFVQDVIIFTGLLGSANAAQA